MQAVAFVFNVLCIAVYLINKSFIKSIHMYLFCLHFPCFIHKSCMNLCIRWVWIFCVLLIYWCLKCVCWVWPTDWTQRWLISMTCAGRGATSPSCLMEMHPPTKASQCWTTNPTNFRELGQRYGTQHSNNTYILKNYSYINAFLKVRKKIPIHRISGFWV